jgi:hypothetical protein
MRKALLISLVLLVLNLPAALAQDTVQGQWTGLTQCYVNGTWITVRGNCPAAPSTGTSSSTSAAYSGLSSAGYQLVYAFGRWLFGGGSNPQQGTGGQK